MYYFCNIMDIEVSTFLEGLNKLLQIIYGKNFN
jgi:hypothetical protein